MKSTSILYLLLVSSVSIGTIDSNSLLDKICFETVRLATEKNSPRLNDRNKTSSLTRAVNLIRQHLALYTELGAGVFDVKSNLLPVSYQTSAPYPLPSARLIEGAPAFVDNSSPLHVASRIRAIEEHMHQNDKYDPGVGVWQQKNPEQVSEFLTTLQERLGNDLKQIPCGATDTASVKTARGDGLALGSGIMAFLSTTLLTAAQAPTTAGMGERLCFLGVAATVGTLIGVVVERVVSFFATGSSEVIRAGYDFGDRADQILERSSQSRAETIPQFLYMGFGANEGKIQFDLFYSKETGLVVYVWSPEVEK